MNHTHTVRHEVAPSKPAQALQVVQGAYYVVTGLLVALAVEYVQGPVTTDGFRSGWDLGPVRVIAAGVAVFGAAMVLSGSIRGRPFLGAWAGMWVALALLLYTAGGTAFGVLPMTFLLDAALELLFLVLWPVMMFARIDQGVDRASALPT